MWPMEALTLKFRPKYLLIVFAFAGDSTMTSDFPMVIVLNRKARREAVCPFHYLALQKL